LFAGADLLTREPAKWPFERKLAELLQVDVTGTMLVARALGRWMKDRGRGVVITCGWDQAAVGMEGDSGELFAAAKGAVMAFTRSLARSLGPEVRANCVAPGWIKTAWGAGASEAWQQRAVRESMLGRWGTPEDIAAAVHWLVSPQAAFVTGQTVNVNGGFRRA
jgi:NAD(P)-dependent dehydrogenase (short-subunit alcohol dehydrogenase family)